MNRRRRLLRWIGAGVVGGGAAAAWTPEQPILGALPTVWIDPEYGVYTDTGKTTPATALGLVGAMEDRSGNGNDVLSESNKPTYIYGVGFDSLIEYAFSTFLKSAAFSAALTQPTTIFIVSRFYGGLNDGSSYILFSGIASGNRHQLWKGSTPSPDAYQIYAGSTVSTTQVPDYLNLHLFTVLFNGANSKIWLDGTLIQSGDVGTHTLSGLSLGADHTPAGYYNGALGPVLVYNADMTSARTTIEAYLSSRYPAYRVTDLVKTTPVATAAGSWHGRVSLEVLDSGVWVMTYKTGSAHGENDGALHIRFSTDQGATWTAEDTFTDASAVTGFPMNPSTVTAGEDAGEPWLYLAPNGDLILHMWRADYGVTANGTYQSTSTDDGATWSASAAVDFSGIADDAKVFATDDHFVYDGVIYAAARQYQAASGATIKSIFIKSIDNGANWVYVSDMSTFTNNTNEVGIEYLGGTNIIAIFRSTGNDKTYKATSADMGATWSSLTEIQTNHVGILGRPRIFTDKHLKGEANWWTDTTLIMCGYIVTVSGQSAYRRNAVWRSLDSGATWSEPYYLDIIYGDGGYGDMVYDGVGSLYCYITYAGTMEAASVVQYKFNFE